jgi:hypothetical protein
MTPPNFLNYLLTASLVILLTSCSRANRTENLLATHPRIMLLEGEEDLIRQSIEANPVWERMHEAILAASDRMIETELLERNMVGRRLLGTSREVLRRVFYLSYAYRMTGEEKYAARAEKEMLAAAGFADWNPAHFLDVGEMTMALAIGYDWLYHVLPEESREAIREAILTKGLEPSFDPAHNWFLSASHNWNQVCNAGMTFGAIAVYEHYPEIAREIIDRAFNTIGLSKEDYEPDGAYPEGYGYWNYGTTFNVMFLSAVDRIWPGRFDYGPYSAFMNTGSFMKNMVAPSGVSYNWGDNSAGGGLSPAMFWFADKNNKPSLLWKEKFFLEREDFNRFTSSRLLPAIMIWGRNIDMDEIEEPGYTSYVAQGPMPLSLKRTSWDDPDAIYLGFKGGSPSVNHGHMDIGSFVLEADGVRWASDAGVQGYNSLESLGMNIWDTSQDGERWTVLRLNNHIHNTLTVNGELQRVEGYAKIDRHSGDDVFSFAITDMSSVYDTQLAEAIRGAGIVDGQYVVIRDEIKTGERPAVVRWKMLTRADVSVTGGNSATLKKDGRELVLRVDEPARVKVTTWSSQSPNEWDSPNPGTVLVGFEIEVPENSNETLDVKLIPGSSGAGAEFSKNLSDW